MLLIEHILNAMLQKGFDFVEKYGAAIVYPDAIRAYTGDRRFSHFECSIDGQQSAMIFPNTMTISDPCYFSNKLIGPTSEDLGISCAIGDDTNINAFYKYNLSLPEIMQKGIEMHLMQDIAFDALVRSTIDCSLRKSDIYVYHDQKINGKTLRKLIFDIEQQDIFYLAFHIYKKTGIICNQKWMDTNIKPILYRDYPEYLAEKTYSYMNIDSKIDHYITERNWNHLEDGPLHIFELDRLFSDSLNR